MFVDWEGVVFQYNLLFFYSTFFFLFLWVDFQ